MHSDTMEAMQGNAMRAASQRSQSPNTATVTAKLIG